MMDWTDRHCRVFHRLLSRRARLYTEMLTTGAIIHGDRARLLGFDASEHPVALQLGGSDPRDLAGSNRMQDGRPFGCQLKRIAVAAGDERRAAAFLLVADRSRKKVVRLVTGSLGVRKTARCHELRQSVQLVKDLFVEFASALIAR